MFHSSLYNLSKTKLGFSCLPPQKKMVGSAHFGFPGDSCLTCTEKSGFVSDFAVLFVLSANSKRAKWHHLQAKKKYNATIVVAKKGKNIYQDFPTSEYISRYFPHTFTFDVLKFRCPVCAYVQHQHLFVISMRIYEINSWLIHYLIIIIITIIFFTINNT